MAFSNCVAAECNYGVFFLEDECLDIHSFLDIHSYDSFLDIHSHYDFLFGSYNFRAFQDTHYISAAHSFHVDIHFHNIDTHEKSVLGNLRTIICDHQVDGFLINLTSPLLKNAHGRPLSNCPYFMRHPFNTRTSTLLH